MFLPQASAERTFSTLKLIENYFRNTMGQERFSSLVIIPIENEPARNLDFSNRTNEYESSKKDFSNP